MEAEKELVTNTLPKDACPVRCRNVVYPITVWMCAHNAACICHWSKGQMRSNLLEYEMEDNVAESIGRTPTP